MTASFTLLVLSSKDRGASNPSILYPKEESGSHCLLIFDLKPRSAGLKFGSTIHVANDMAKSIFSERKDLLKFQRLLALILLYDCVLEDYEQLESESDSEHYTNGYRGLLNINGIVVKCLDRQNQVILKPVASIYDSSFSEYIDMSGFIVPPAVLNAVLNPFHCFSYEAASKPNCSLSDFLLYIEQITGFRLRLPNLQLDTSSCYNDDRLIGGKSKSD